MKLYDDAVLDAAASREAGDSAGAWRLADALLAAIPADRDNTSRHSRDAAGMTIPAKLAEYERMLAAEGIETPAGGPYSARSLEDLRTVAMAWEDTSKRYPQAAFRTHQEAGRPGSDLDVALKALCKYAGGGVKRRPTEIDPEAWAKAVEMVDRLLKRKAKYAVSANTLRVAVQRKNNTHTPVSATAPEPVTATAAAAAIKSLPPHERAAAIEDLVATDPDTRKDVETAVRKVRSDELAVAHQHFEDEHAGKRKTRTGGADDAPTRTVVDQPLALLGVLIETEPMKDMLPKVVQIVSDKRDMLADDDIEYLREWSATMRRNLDILDELLKLGTGLTDEAIESLLKGE